MSKIVITSLGSHGDINPYMAIGKELHKRGHIVVITTSPYYESYIKDHGLEFSPLRPDIQPTNEELYKRVTDPIRGSEYIIRELVMPHIKDSYNDISAAANGADLIISHVLSHAVPIYAEKHKIKWISTVLSPLVFCSAYETPAFPPIPWTSKLRVFGPRFNSMFLTLLKKISYGWSKPVRQLRKGLGLGPGRDPLWEGQHSPTRVLALFSNEFGKCLPDWPPQTITCGFPFFDPPSQTSSENLEEFMITGESPVVFTLGSSAVKAAGNFYETALEVSKELNIKALFIAGDRQLSTEGFPNLKFVSWAEHASVFSRARAIVHSGGVGTTAQALRSGKPQLVIPFANDQFDNADRIERIGTGHSLAKYKVKKTTFSNALQNLFGSSSIEEKAKEVGLNIRQENGSKRAADEIEKVLTSSSS